MITRPNPDEYPEFYGGYITLVPDTDILTYLEEQIKKLKSLGITWKDKDAGYQYAPGKWSVRQIIGHVCDTERVFAYRAMCFSRNEKASLPGFDQDEYVAESNFDTVPFEDLIDEFILLRESNLRMFHNFNDRVWSYSGIANGKKITIRSILYIMAGHLDHHLHIVQERYS